MNGKDLVAIIERELISRGISKSEFYKECKISSATLSNWRNGIFQPTAKNIQMISDYFGIQIAEQESTAEDEETIALREMLRDRQDLRILLNSAKDVPVSSVYALIAQIEKIKEEKG